MTLNGVMVVTLRYFAEFGRLWSQLRQSDEVRPRLSVTEMELKNLVFGNTRLIAIFSEVNEKEYIKQR